MSSRSGDIVSYSMLQIVYWWLVRATLVVAFGFLPQNFGRWWGPMNSKLSSYEWRFSGEVVSTFKPYLMQKEFV